MRITPRVRRYNPGEESKLFNVYYTSIHQLASQEYSPEQIQAWAPRDIDTNLWEKRIRGINPFVAELNDELVGYADLQASGYIDHFFVSGSHARRGIGTSLMNHILREARLAGLHELTSDVSRTAQAFYETFGFTVVEQRQPELRGVVIPNAFMRLRIV